MSKERIRFSASILRRLGEELNLGFDQGILELVKNAYDADALTCEVELLNVDQPGGTVRVRDTGDGMTDKQIINGWLVLGESSKDSGKQSRLGRFPAGNKGLGRLAALRMGTCADLLTRPASEPNMEYLVSIDWKRYDQAASVDEVDLDVIGNLLPGDVETGTEIIISNLREPLTRMDVKRLARGILLLADPFGNTASGGFQPVLKAEGFDDLAKLVERRYFNDSEFHLHAEVGADGLASAVVQDYNGKILYQATHTTLRSKRDNQPYNLPPVKFDLWVFIFDSRVFATRNISKGEVRNWLSDFGGVHMYINDIRVTPYGNPGDDWLNLNLSRVQHPEFRPSTNTSIGRISISEPGSRFVQKTDRTGLIENESFVELKIFAKDALDYMSRERLREAEHRRGNMRAETTSKVQRERIIVEDVFKELPLVQQALVKKSFDRYDQARESQVTALRNDVLLYRTLGTVGIVSAVFAHETTRPADLIERNTRLIEKRAKKLLGQDYNSKLRNPVELILAQTSLMEGFQTMTLGFIEKDKRRNKRVEVHAVIKAALANFESILRERHVTVTTQLLAEGEPYLRGSAAALEAVLANFIVNSVRAFQERQVGNHQIIIRTTAVKEFLTIRFMDNGPGIDTIDPKDIWTPGESGYDSGTGLGLTIVRDTIRDLGGSVDVLAHGELHGAEFIVTIPVLGFS